ncbi:hypothetical protein DEU56DRAFT_758051 [Suillus clintonianus]|uniref:uncharacterized protein n=1 Tax=Suillus clintonianus TaxID=1904413 RepID=UPI001B87E815|nr:uncharacterized protein DEU56DRAFT_758051 [Suillus clintonianus]KAG2129765.1 hypothetical protein DEU56DRAFT_758051 [Suillus clintonianus]
MTDPSDAARMQPLNTPEFMKKRLSSFYGPVLGSLGPGRQTRFKPQGNHSDQFSRARISFHQDNGVVLAASFQPSGQPPEVEEAQGLQGPSRAPSLYSSPPGETRFASFSEPVVWVVGKLGRNITKAVLVALWWPVAAWREHYSGSSQIKRRRQTQTLTHSLVKALALHGLGADPAPNRVEATVTGRFTDFIRRNHGFMVWGNRVCRSLCAHVRYTNINAQYGEDSGGQRSDAAIQDADIAMLGQ